MVCQGAVSGAGIEHFGVRRKSGVSLACLLFYMLCSLNHRDRNDFSGRQNLFGVLVEVIKQTLYITCSMVQYHM